MLYFTNDHRGHELKLSLLNLCQENQIPAQDLWPNYDPADDYPDSARVLAEKLKSKEDFGVAICGSGQGICIAMNRYSWVRAALTDEPEEAIKARQHDYINCLCLSGDSSKNTEEMFIVLRAFLDSTPDPAPRHQRRIDKISRIGEK